MGIAELARRGLALRQWERQNLPTEGSQLGYEVFMKLADLVASEGTGQPALLKQLYLELPYSEKGIRLHLRRLEATGWITVQKGGADGRGGRIELSSGYWALLGEYEAQWLRLLNKSVPFDQTASVPHLVSERAKTMTKIQ